MNNSNAAEKRFSSVAISSAPQYPFGVIKGGRDLSSTKLTGTAPLVLDREVVILGVVLAALQILDGVLTAIGVSHLGIDAEANPLIRQVMLLIGAIPALLVLKSLAIAIVGVLCFLALSVNWLRPAMKVVAAIYLICAVAPWSAILANTHLISLAS